WNGMKEMWGDFTAWALDMLESPIGTLVNGLENFTLPSFTFRVPDGFTTTHYDLKLFEVDMPTGLSMRNVTIGGGKPFEGVAGRVQNALGHAPTGSHHRGQRRSDAAAGLLANPDEAIRNAYNDVSEDTVANNTQRLMASAQSVVGRREFAETEIGRLRGLMETKAREAQDTNKSLEQRTQALEEARRLAGQIAGWQRALEELGDGIRRNTDATA